MKSALLRFLLSFSLHIPLHSVRIFPIFSSSNNAIVFYLILSVHCVCQLFLFMTQTLAHQVTDAMMVTLNKVVRFRSWSSYCCASDVTAACLSLKMAIAPGFMIGQTCFVLCLEIMLLELTDRRSFNLVT